MNGKPELALDARALGLKGASNVRVEVLDGGKAIQLAGDAGKDWKGRPQPLKVTLVLTEQRRVAVTQDHDTSTTLAVPVGRQPSTAAAALPSVPGSWVNIDRQAKLKLLDGDKVVWQGALQGSVSFPMGKRTCTLSVRSADGQVYFDLRDASATPAPSAN
jgi:hypothetical protein